MIWPHSGGGDGGERWEVDDSGETPHCSGEWACPLTATCTSPSDCCHGALRGRHCLTAN